MTNAILEDRLLFGEVVGVDAFNFATKAPKTTFS
jgi:hypothetical protein